MPSVKNLCLIKTKVKIFDPGNIRQNKLQMQYEKPNSQNVTQNAVSYFYLP